MSGVYIDAVLAANPSQPLNQHDLDALTGLLSALPASLPSDHALFQRLQQTLLCGGPVSLDLVTSWVEVCIRLAHEPPNRPPVFHTLEVCHGALDRFIAQLVCGAEHTGGALERPRTLQLASRFLVLLMLVSPHAGATTSTSASAGGGGDAGVVLELFHADVGLVVAVTAEAVAAVGGVKVGAAPLVKDPHQRKEAVAQLVDLLRGVAAWHTIMAVAPSSVRENARRNTPMVAASRPYRHHVALYMGSLTKCNVFADLALYLKSVAPADELANHPDNAHLIRSVLLFIDSAFTLTGEYAAQLRKCFTKSGLFETFIVPCVQKQLARLSSGSASAAQSVRVGATVSFGVKGCHAYLAGQKDVVAAVNGVSCEAVQALDTRARVEVVGQLVRLIVNGHIARCSAALLDVWRRALTDEEKTSLALQLADPMRRRQPLDVYSPCYEEVRPVFAFIHGKAAGPKRAERASSDQTPGLANSHGKDNTRHQQGQRPRRIRRRRKRYAQLRAAQQHVQSVERSADDLAAQLSGSSSDSGSDVDDDKAAEKDEEVCPSPDLSRWRPGPPPYGVPLRYICALSHRIIRSVPVISPLGYVFDQDCILNYLAETNSKRCPVSGQPLRPDDLLVDDDLQRELERVRLSFADVT